MKLLITTDGCPFDVEIERMTYLFYEDCELTIRPIADVHGNEWFDLRVDLRLMDSPEGITAVGELRTGTQVLSATKVKDVPSQAEPVTVRRRAKQAVMHVLHQLFEAVTEQHQPWGILTGIRPLKLLHGLLERGMSRNEARRELASEYLISQSRIDLLMEIAEVQLDVVPDLYQLDEEVSIYIGIPFCPTHCAYCTFPAYSMTEKATYVDSFLHAMDLEFAQVGRLLREYDIPITSVYVGGGTPTSLRAAEMEWMMESIFRELPGPETWREFTVEAGRPDTITPDRVKVMKKYGVNRISVNPQTFKAITLKTIGRGHTPDIVDHRFHYVRDAGFENINMDMILGLPGETLDDVKYTMERIKKLNPESVTVHTMSLKRSAVVKTERDRFEIPHSELVRMMMDEAATWARGLGYHPYYVYRQKDILGNLENVGYAKPGKDSIYNICIMEERQTIIGIGGGAASKFIGPGAKNMGRFADPREPKAFVETIEQVMERKEKALRPVLEAIHRRHV